MSKNPYCKICNGYHWERESYYDSDFNQTFYFCSTNHKSEYLNKKANPNYKTSQDRYMDKYNAEKEERLAASRAKREAIFEEMDNRKIERKETKRNETKRPNYLHQANKFSFDRHTKKQAWYNSNGKLILALIFIWPLGLYGLRARKKAKEA